MKFFLFISLFVSISVGFGKVPSEIEERFEYFFPADSSEVFELISEIEEYNFKEQKDLILFLESYYKYKNFDYYKALDISKNINLGNIKNTNSILKLNVLPFIADIYAFGSDYVRAYNLYEYILFNFNYDDKYFSVRQYNGMIINYLECAYNIGKRANAVIFINKIYKERGFELTHEIYMLMMKNAREEGLYEIALDYAKGLYKYRLEDNEFEYFDYYITLHDIYRSMKDYNLALNEILKAKDHIELEYQKIIFNYKLASIEKFFKNYDKSLIYLKAILESNAAYDYNLSGISIDMVYKELASVYLELGKLDKAESFIKKHDSTSEKQITSKINKELINLNYARNNFDNIEKLALDYLNYAESKGNINDKLDAYEILFKYYDTINNLNYTNIYLKKYLHLNEKINNDNRKFKIEQIKDDYDKRFSGAEEILARDQRVKIIVLFLILGIIILVIIAYYMVRFQKKRKEERKLVNQSQKIVTDNKKLEEINREIAYNQEILKDYSEVQDQMLKVLIHDLNTPMASISISARTLLSYGADLNEKERKEIYQRIKQLSELSTSILENQNEWILKRSSKIAFEPEYIDIETLLNEIVNHFSSAATKKKINFFIDEMDLIIYTDVYMIEIVIRNIISNAIKFTNYGGKIEIFTSNINNKTFLNIADSGIGIDDKVIDEILNSETSKSENGTAGEKGLGYGLKITRDFIERMDSEFLVKNNQSGGATFAFLLNVIE